MPSAFRLGLQMSPTGTLSPPGRKPFEPLKYTRLSRSGCQDTTAFGVIGLSLPLAELLTV
jgi:hypothetical protein